MVNEFSVEDLISIGTGLVNNKKETSTSIEGYDGYEDGIFAEVTRSEETLKFLDTMELMERKSASDKMKMLKKISNSYNKRTIGNAVAANSIESFINTQVYSLEADGEGVPATTNNNAAQPASAPTDDKQKEKKQTFFKKVWEAIKRFIKTVGDLIKRVIAKVKTFFMKLTVKNAAELVKENPFGADEEVYDLSTINFAGAKSYISKMEKIDLKITSSGNENQPKLINKALNKTNKLPTDEKEIAAALFGIRTVKGEVAFKKANPKVVTLVKENLPKLIEALDKIQKNIERYSNIVETGIKNDQTIASKKDDGTTETLTPEEAAKTIKEYAMSVQKTTIVGTKIMDVVAKLINKNTTTDTNTEKK